MGGFWNWLAPQGRNQQPWEPLGAQQLGQAGRFLAPPPSSAYEKELEEVRREMLQEQGFPSTTLPPTAPVIPSAPMPITPPVAPRGIGDSNYLVKPPEIPDYSNPQVGGWPPNPPPPSGWRPPMALPGTTPPAAAAQPAFTPGRVTAGENGILLTNLPGVGRDLAMPGDYPDESFHLRVGERIGGGLSPGGQREFATVRAGQGAFTPGAAPLTGKTWDEVRNEPNPILRAEWERRNMEGAPLQALEADLGVKEAEAERERRQAGLFGAQEARLRMSPEERALEQTNLPLQGYVEKLIQSNPQMKDYVDFLQIAFMRQLLVEGGYIKEGQQVPPGFVPPKELMNAARQRAISKFIEENQTQIQLAEARYGG